MKITKFRKISNGKYKVFLEDGSSLSLYEDVIINNNLLITKNIDDDILPVLLNQNNEFHIHYLAIKYISVRMRSIKEMRSYLERKNIDNILIDQVINTLIKEGYLNDFNFAKAYCNDQIIISTKGPDKIRKELVEFGISNDIINDVIDEIDDDIIKEKLSNLIKKQIKIRKGSAKALKIKLVNYFKNLGYSSELILKELSNYKLKSDINKLEKDYNRLYSKYKDKYNDSELKYVLAQKLYAKGYTSEDVSKIDIN